MSGAGLRRIAYSRPCREAGADTRFSRGGRKAECQRSGALADILPLRRGGRAGGVPGRVAERAVSVSFCRDGKCGGRELNRGGMSGKLPKNAVPEGFGALSNGRFSSLRQEISVFEAGNFRLSAKKFSFFRMAFCIFAEYGLQICGLWRIFMRNDTQTGRFSGFCGAGKRPLPAILSVPGEGRKFAPERFGMK